jgi:DNA uptake protein ComE-like DNA-binding protein
MKKNWILLFYSCFCYGKIILLEPYDLETSAPTLKVIDDQKFHHHIEQTITENSLNKTLIKLHQHLKYFKGENNNHTFVLLSEKTGGFAEKGFQTKEQSYFEENFVHLFAKRSLIPDSLGETFAHEMGHVFQSLLMNLPPRISTKPHMSLTDTDPITAFEEGYSISFQALYHNLKPLDPSRDMNLTIQSDFDAYARHYFVPLNHFIFSKPKERRSFNINNLLEHFTQGVFDFDHLKNGQQMMSSEGVIASLFYRILTNSTLQNNYESPEFYQAFFKSKLSSKNLKQKVSPHLNIHFKILKIFSSMTCLPSGQPFLLFLSSYLKQYPLDRQVMSSLFVLSTRGVTLNPQHIEQYKELNQINRSGPTHKKKLMQFMKQIDCLSKNLQKEGHCEKTVGPALWIKTSVEIPENLSKINSKKRNLILNLNAASDFELQALGWGKKTIQSFIKQREKQGYFSCLDEIKIDPKKIQSLKESQVKF